MKLRAYPVVRILLFFMLGLLSPVLPFYVLPGGFIIVTLGTVIGLKYKRQVVYLFCTWVGISLFGNTLQFVEVENKKRAIDLSNSDAYLAQIISKPEKKPKSYKTEVKIIKLLKDSTWQEANQNILLYFSNKSAAPSFEQVYLIHGSPRTIEGPKNPEEFNYKAFQERKGIAAHHFLREGDYELLGIEKQRWYLRLAYSMNTYANEVFEKHIEGSDEMAVAQAMVIGQKDELTQELRQSYATAGAIHILAVSGLHVGILFLLLKYLFGWMLRLPNGKVWFSIVVILCLWLYALFTGFSPSVTRATLMFSVIQVGLITRREKNSINTIAFSALVLLIIKPSWIFEVGFQLSYLAILGIVILFPYINRLWRPRYILVQKLWQLSIVSISAQLFTFPLSVYYFHQFPNYFLLTNPIVTVLSTVILFSGVGLLIISWIPYFSEAAGWVLDTSLTFLNESVAWIEKLPSSKMAGLYLDSTEMIILYSILLFGLLFLFKKHPSYFKIAATLCMLFMLLGIYNFWYKKDQKKLVIHYVPKSVAISFIDHQKVTLMADSATLADDRVYGFHFKNYYDALSLSERETETVDSEEQLTLSIDGEKILWLKTYTRGLVTDEFDKVLISNNAVYDLQKKFKTLPKHIILDDTNSFYRVKKIKEDSEKLGIKCTSLYENGALVIEL